MKTSLSICLAMLTICLCPFSWAQDEDLLRQEIRQNEAAIKKRKDEVALLNREHRAISNRLFETQEKIASLSKRLEETKTKLQERKQRLEQIHKEITITEKRLFRTRKKLEKRLLQIYQEGEVSYISVLFQSHSFTDFANQAEFLQRVVERDKVWIDRVRSYSALLDQKKVESETIIQELSELRDGYKKDLLAVRRLEASQKLEIAELRRSRAQAYSAVEALEHITKEKERELQALIAARLRSGSAGGTGQLIAPVNGVITSPFGYRVHPIRGTTRLHTGIDYGVGQGTPIYSADFGTVIYSGWYGGYGNCIIIQHTPNMTTLYAHCSALLAREGQAVNRGQHVASVGSTGMSTGPHLHFEVRLNGTPVDPSKYL